MLVWLHFHKVAMRGEDGGVTAGWGGGRPYANAHLVLEANERVVDAQFQQLMTVTELAAWGYRVRACALSRARRLCIVASIQSKVLRFSGAGTLLFRLRFPCLWHLVCQPTKSPLLHCAVSVQLRMCPARETTTHHFWSGFTPHTHDCLIWSANALSDARRTAFCCFRLKRIKLSYYRQPRSGGKGHGGGGNAPAAAVPMLAVLTTRRVVMLSAPRLTPIAEAWGHPRNSRFVLGDFGGLSVSPVAIAWAGSSVVCTLEDGR